MVKKKDIILQENFMRLPAIQDSINSSVPMVRKSNLLARAALVRESERSVFSLWERRLIALVASKIQWDDVDFKEYKIKVEELLGKEYGGKNLEELEKVVKRAMRRQLQIRTGNDWIIYTLFTKCAFHSGTGTLTVCFHPDLKPHYLHLRQSYVQYELSTFLSLPSVYSQGLFEVLKSWANLPEATIPLEELHEILAVPQSMKKDFSQFRIRVLEKAKQDIEKNTNFYFIWEPVKTGRSVTAIRFIFTTGPIQCLVRNLANQKNQKVSNDFGKYIECYKKRGPACSGGFQSESVCEICRKLR